ncbi:hypothetical protein EKO27_g2545 [Xylaria grammica]|uniref:Uncharacterized protein n=1 Tax=Xylaria grammica TaxID=363999 RepID=A0A439DDU5_9PEZI|nr:hypothetical protein EKO27_g2545 [Xylaria grammica]
MTDVGTPSTSKNHNGDRSAGRSVQAPEKPVGDYVGVRREWATRGSPPKPVQGDVNAQNSKPIMVQRWENESSREQMYNNVGSVWVPRKSDYLLTGHALTGHLTHQPPSTF